MAQPEVLDPVGVLPARVIADLHLRDGALGAGGPADPGAFATWLAGLPAGQGLLILGDLFEYWTGTPDLACEGYRPVLDALAARTAGGDFVGIVPGNRDFLLGSDFVRRTGVRLFPAGLVLAAGGRRWLMLHGDELCTRDTGYQRLRTVLRSRMLRGGLALLPGAARRAIARRLRRASKESVPRKDPAELAMQPDAAAGHLETSGCDVLLVGHAHRYRREGLPGNRDWIVLDAFGEGAHDRLELLAGPMELGADWAYTALR
ncbi:MAG: UDP-2,3-diacylglucosamine diphosphatase [Planctomycetota bacterium]